MKKIMLLLIVVFLTTNCDNTAYKNYKYAKSVIGQRILYCGDTVEIIGCYNDPKVVVELSNGKYVQIEYVQNKGTLK
jgi:hypothetical protein